MPTPERCPESAISEEMVRIQEALSRTQDVARSIEEKVCAVLREEMPAAPAAVIGSQESLRTSRPRLGI